MSDNKLAIVLADYDAINQKNPRLAAEKLDENVQMISYMKSHRRHCSSDNAYPIL